MNLANPWWIMLFLSGFFLAPFAGILMRFFRSGAGWFFSLVALANFTFLLTLAPEIFQGKDLFWSLPWMPQIGLDLAFRLDGLSLLFALLVSGIGFMIFLYTAAYFTDAKSAARFSSRLLVFFGAMLGLVLANHPLLLFFFWEMTSITSYLLIGFKNESENSRGAALSALLVTSLGGLALLAGLILLGQASTASRLSDLSHVGVPFPSHSLQLAAAALILIAAFTKSAQFPFHAWLPQAMAAPTPASAYLHSAAMVKAGIYLIARFHPVFGELALWQWSLLLCGAVTFLGGALRSLFQDDGKRLLAETTLSALGLLVFGFGLGEWRAGLLFLVIHSLYKATLFLSVGNVEKATGTRQISKLGSLAKVLPSTTFAASIAVASMLGLPPFLGFVGKELLYESLWENPARLALVVFGNAVIGSAGLRVVYGIFLRRRRAEGSARNQPLPWMSSAAPLLLGVLGLLLGIFPAKLEPLIAAALRDLEVAGTGAPLELWHGFNSIFILSLATILLAAIFLAFVEKFFPLREKTTVDAPLKNLPKILRGATALTDFFQHGYLRHYLATIFGFAVLALCFGLRHSWDFSRNFSLFARDSIFLGLGISSVFFLLASRQRLGALLFLGVLGLVVTLVFALNGAPDLALTQVLIEVLTVILFLLVVYRLPRFQKLSSRFVKIRDAVLALSFGGLVTVLILQAQSGTLFPSIAGFFEQNSFTQAFGRNVVNVLLVDFRGFDTLGEISVLATAALGVAGLLHRRGEP